MSKIGKKYNLSLLNSSTQKEFSSFLNEASVKNVKITNFKESYDNTEKLYVGEMVFTGDITSILELETSSKQYFGTYISTNFSIDTHYEELVELKGEQITTGISGSLANLKDSLQLYKYKNPLEYNFLIKNYENFLIANPNIQETALPYFYDVLSDFVISENYQGFEGTTFFESPSKIITENFRTDLKTNVIPSEVVVDDKELRIDKYLEKFNIYKEQFPFYADISFDMHELDEKSIIGALQRKKLYPKLLETILNKSSGSFLNVSSTGSTSISSINVKQLDIKDFLYEQLDLFAETDFTFIFDINQRVDNKSRTFLEVINNEEEYSEVVGYHLKKYRGNTSDLIQEWYLPNTGEGALSWVDSQIKYNKLYTYKLDLVVLTFATEYQITNSYIEDNKLVIKFVNKPLIKTYVLESSVANPRETLGATYTNKLLDYPPMDPEMELIPYIGIDNQIKISLNTSTGKKTIPAISFSAAEETKNDELRLAQDKDITSDLLTFQTDEPADSMEIYKLDFKPRSYNDFIGNSVTNLSTNGSAGVSYVDTIEPNKKYYYIARAIDFHRNISNPTVIYELEIINDNGLIIPFIKVVDFDKDENDKEQIKSFKRYVKIQPNLVHRLVNTQKTNSNNIDLGSLNVSPWNRKFKLRLTSKSTGKKIDVNFTFKYKKPQ